VTLGALFARTLALFGLGAVLMALGTARQAPDVRRARATKLLSFFLIVHGVLALAVAGRIGVLALIGGILARSAWEGNRAWRRIEPPRPFAMALFASAIAFGAVVAAIRVEPSTVAWVFLCVAAFDGFSQVTGQWLGRHALAPKISPKKTVEGLAGGLLGTALVALWLRELAGYDGVRAASLGIALGVASMVGDLSGSWIKRRAGIKDFSTILPGQGGFLDRFNSFITALATVGVLLGLHLL
jgi:CDP-diglyceride synthetase